MFDTKFKAGLIDVSNGIFVRRGTMDGERNLAMTNAPDVEILVKKERMNYHQDNKRKNTIKVVWGKGKHPKKK